MAPPHADADTEYLPDISDNEVESNQVTRGAGASTRARGQGTKGAGWEVTRTWENVVEGADGTINSTVEGLLKAGKRKRLLKDTTPLQRGIIRHLILIIDLSTAMLEKDLRPTRYLLTLRYVEDFIKEFFDQNPISQLGIIGMRDGIALRVSDVGGNPSEHIGRVKKLRGEDPRGQVSLQNALEMGRGSLFHAPTHTTREILLIVGSLLSSDPGDIHTTISGLVTSHITCTVISLAAEIAILRTLTNRTNPGLRPEDALNVPLDEVHYRELVMKAVTPPATGAASSKEEDDSEKASLLMMGFPSRIPTNTAASLCACHSNPVRGGYLCSRCSSKVCALPTKCPGCGLTLILSTHLARSYHHLFPLRNWTEVGWEEASRSPQAACGGCLAAFPTIPPGSRVRRHSSKGEDDNGAAAIHGSNDDSQGKNDRKARLGPNPTISATKSNNHPPSHKRPSKNGVSESGRYACEACRMHFCIDCDVFAHEVVHNCPGCQSLPAGGMQSGSSDSSSGGRQDGAVEAVVAMEEGDQEVRNEGSGLKRREGGG